MRPYTSSVLAALAISTVASPLESRTGLKIPLTKRSELVAKNLVLNPELLSQHAASAVDKILRGFAIYEANTGTPHSLAGSTVANKRATGADPLTDDAGYGLWQGAISVGTPPVGYTVDFDTGSTDLFLPGPNCNTNCAGHNAYYPTSSSTSTALGATFSLLYGDGSSVQGTTYSDNVIVSGLTATKQTLGAATTYSTGFSYANFPPDGLLGLAWAQLSAYGAPGYFQTLVAESQVTSPVFAFKLATSGSELYLGGIDTALYTGAITYVPVTQEAYWQVVLGAISANGVTSVSNVAAIVDTGTTLIIGPPSQVQAFYASIPGSSPAPAQYGSGLYTVPCNSIPSVSLTFGGRSFPVSASTFNLGSISSTACVGGIIAMSGINFWIVGDVFLQNVYTVFDVGNVQVGFATLA